jgi:hypothetical protein
MANLHQPRIIETTTVRSGGSADESSIEHVTERMFRMEDGDSLWVGINGISLERGKFGSDRDVLRIDSYSGTILADALVENLRIQASLAKDETANSFCRKQAQEFVERAAAALGLHLEVVQ